MDLAKRRGLSLATVTGDVDLSTDDGQFMARVMAAVARKETDRKSARQKAANKQRAKAGKAWVQRTFGYDSDEIVPREAEAIRKASHALLNGATLWSIAKEWNATKLLTAKGCTWTGGTVRQVLARPRNAGLQVYDGEVLEGVQTAWKSIVPRDVWEVCARCWPTRSGSPASPLAASIC
jgi:DNA invertase Pin-like site-specific DNA recombinase